MSTLIIAEHDNSSLKMATLNTVAAAQLLGADIDILVAGANCGGAAEAAAGARRRPRALRRRALQCGAQDAAGGQGIVFLEPRPRLLLDRLV